MNFSQKRALSLRILTISGFVFSVIAGLSLGLALAGTENMKLAEATEPMTEAVGTKVLDIKGRVITEFFSDEKRDLIPLSQMPNHLVDALTTREDADFWYHAGFSPRGFSRAIWGILSRTLVSGGSTLTQQLAKMQYLNPRDRTITRKIVELWYAFQMERRYSKQEILQMYLNKMPFGHGAYGVEAASQFYFRKSVRDISPAESTILAIQLVLPGLYSPIRNPEGARDRSRTVLDQMVEARLLAKEDADQAFTYYWDHYDYNRSSAETLFSTRDDKAPYFSEYIRGKLSQLLPETANIYKDGYTVHTSLNLDFQKIAEQEFYQGLATASQIYKDSASQDPTATIRAIIPEMEILALATGIRTLRFSGKQAAFNAKMALQTTAFPVLELTTGLLGLESMSEVSKALLKREQATIQKSVVEGAMVTLDNKTGYILVMVGGSPFSRVNQFNRAVLAKVQPGSAYKPLYYSVAFDEKKITAGTRLLDAPRVFSAGEGADHYAPSNYGGKWYGNVLPRYALAMSLNIPSLQVLEAVGFDAAIAKTTRMLGFKSQKEIDAVPRNFPLGLGTIGVTPLQMARAFTTFPNLGTPVDPLSIRYITDRVGNTILNPEADLVNQQQSLGASRQVNSPQAAYIMTNMLKSSVEFGTLFGAVQGVGGFGGIDVAGKTGTTQNWSDAWAMGFSPYMTTAVWYGFDKPGNSLGIANNGAQTSAPVWARFMKKVHSDLPPKRFDQAGGVNFITINTETGLLPAGYAGEKTRSEPFIAGTGPTMNSSTFLANEAEIQRQALEKLGTQFGDPNAKPQEIDLFGNPVRAPDADPFLFSPTP